MKLHPVTIRFDDDLYNKIIEAKGDKPIAEFCREVLSSSLKNRAGTRDTELVQQLRTENEYLRSELRSAHELVTQAQMVSMTLTKALPEPKEKKRWRWWRK